MKFGVVIFPGSNCDHDMIHVLSTVMGQEVVEVWHKETSLDSFNSEDWIILPGGFSYGDYLRSGAVASFSPIMKSVKEFAQGGGNVLGICNGFQVLCEAHLLPGALLRNRNQQFICRNVFLRTETTGSRVTSAYEKSEVIKIPIAHAEGRYYCDEETLHTLENDDRILFRYCDANGQLSDEANVNGSIDNIAGIMNEGRNVFGMMPHPERASEEELGNTDGRGLFESILLKAAVRS
ncbi:MAG: phosphoribosylformylglycinamidine synthase subunit PurQ [Saprospiraceae bacterium]|nr:phosphoribosylformylglycinamidine synthase subunit PurQ [Saprospiraceae bacterium]